MRQRKALDEQLRADKEHCLKGKTSPYITRVQCTDKKGFKPKVHKGGDLMFSYPLERQLLTHRSLGFKDNLGLK